jgi:methyltransferase (TIGR00027 family)
MPGPELQPEHVSDTALLVAAARAMETGRPDAVIRDAFAGQLAGDRGMALARGVPGTDWMTFFVGMRCRFVDELLLHATAGGAIATVVVLGAGLDTRPWRLALPEGLRWIEVDFPAILNYKTGALASSPSKCRLERIHADLNDADCRQAIFRAAGEGPGLIISEGLLMYLQPETVEELAAQAPATSGIRNWILDVASQDLMRRAHQDSPGVESLRPKGHLRGAQILDVARRHGWTELARRTYTRDGWDLAPERIRAMEARMPMADERGLPSAGDPSGVYLFGR